MKAHGIHQSQTSTVENIRNSTVPTRGKKSPAGGPSRKRKLNQAMEEPSLNDDDEEDFADNVKAEGSGTRVKAEARKKVKHEEVKEEPAVKRAATEGVKDEFESEESTPTPGDSKVRVGSVDASYVISGSSASRCSSDLMKRPPANARRQF